MLVFSMISCDDKTIPINMASIAQVIPPNKPNQAPLFVYHFIKKDK